MLALLLLACTDKPAADDSGDPTAGLCRGDPEITLLSPSEGQAFVLGERVNLEATVTSSVDELTEILWAIDGDVVNVGATGGWVADIAGDLLLTVQAEDRCGLAQQDVHITVRPQPDTGDSGDTGPDDTGDSGDTGDTAPVEASVTTYGASAGLPAGTWTGLSVGPDGALWAANTGGLVRLDPTTGTARVYTSADGLLSDTPTAVLAHSDGTVWVGHLGDLDRQGEQVQLGEDGALTVLQAIDYTESTEIAAVLRLREQPYGKGLGDVWMGTNEGLCLYDMDVPRFDEHAHPTHPHGYTYGVGFTPDGDIWNGDAYQLSRWRYSNDGSLSSGADLYETVAVWPVELEEPVSIEDLDVDGTSVWLASSLLGVARVDVGADIGTSTVDLYTEPATARAIRADGLGNVWIGTDTGLYRWDGATMNAVVADWVPADGVEEMAVDAASGAMWFATSAGLVRVVGIPE